MRDTFRSQQHTTLMRNTFRSQIYTTLMRDTFRSQIYSTLMRDTFRSQIYSTLMRDTFRSQIYSTLMGDTFRCQIYTTLSESDTKNFGFKHARNFRMWNEHDTLRCQIYKPLSRVCIHDTFSGLKGTHDTSRGRIVKTLRKFKHKIPSGVWYTAISRISYVRHILA